MKERIFKNWKSSIVGISIIAIATTALFFGKINGNEWLMILPTGLTFIVAKDSLLSGVTGNLYKEKTQQPENS